jgi:N utilization substance protein B
MSKQPTTRRAAREAALQALYTIEVGKQTPDEALAEVLEHALLDEKAADFTQTLVRATLHNRREIDPVLSRLAVGFPIDRQTVVDRNILRLAAAEILFAASDAPPGAVVNEAVELAKKFSTAESGRFVNGVLGALVRETEKKRADTEKEQDAGE